MDKVQKVQPPPLSTLNTVHSLVYKLFGPTLKAVVIFELL